MEINKIELSDRFAMMWRTSREQAGKSQDYMAKALGVSKKTVQNWEAGTSCPSQEKGFEWFIVLDLHPLPFYLKVLYPDTFGDLSHEDNEDKINNALLAVVSDLPPEAKRKLLYFLTGDHGSSVVGMLELITAHLQTPLRDRLNIAQNVATNYEIAAHNGSLRQPGLIQPNMDMLWEAIAQGKSAVMDGRNTYAAMSLGERK